MIYPIETLHPGVDLGHSRAWHGDHPENGPEDPLVWVYIFCHALRAVAVEAGEPHRGPIFEFATGEAGEYDTETTDVEIGFHRHVQLPGRGILEAAFDSALFRASIVYHLCDGLQTTLT